LPADIPFKELLRLEGGQNPAMKRTDIQLVSSHWHQTIFPAKTYNHHPDLPFVVHGLDDEAKGWTDVVDVFIEHPLDYCCLASIIQASTTA